MFTAKIPKDEQANVMSSFWSMMTTLESDADNTGNQLDRHQVEGYFRQWNKLMKDNKEPRWVVRAKVTA